MVKTRSQAAKPPDPPIFTRPPDSEHHSVYSSITSDPGLRGATPMNTEPGIGSQSNTRERINPYIREDLKSSKRVTIDCWSRAIFSLPEGGLTTWANEIRDLDWFDDGIVRTSLAVYCSTTAERERYEPFTRLTNRIIRLARGALTGVKRTYPVNDFCFAAYDRPVDTIEEHDGLGAVRKPDALGLRNSVAKTLGKQDAEGKRATVRWIDILLPLEFKANPILLLDQLNGQRQKRGFGAVDYDGTLSKPLKIIKKNSKKPAKPPNASAETKDQRRDKTQSAPPVDDDILEPLQNRNQFPGSCGADTEDMVAVNMTTQIASYALELLSCTFGSRLFCLGITIKDDSLHLWYFDASGILLTKQSVSILKNFELFAAIVVGFACCTPEQFGILPTSVVRPHVPYPRNFPPPSLDENTLTITDPHTRKDVSVTFDESLFSQYILVGKRTFLYTIETDPVVCEKKLIMKLSYQVSTRPEEYKLVAIAKKAKVRHLPEIHLWGNLWKLSDGVRAIFQEEAKYEDRVLRAIVYTRYSSIKPLFMDNCLLIPVMVDQMLDCLHDLRYKANILHRDISTNNIMYEKRGDYYHFVLIDFDMAVELPKDGSTLAASSKHRTGTLPFMAYELIADANHATRSSPNHWAPKQHLLYHDLQSLFWVILWCILVFFHHCADAEAQRKILKFLSEWEAGSLSQVAAIKQVIATSPLADFRIRLPGPTVVLDAWLSAWSKLFMTADYVRKNHYHARSMGQELEQFDEETMGGTITRETLKNALTPFMPFKQDPIAVDEVETNDIQVETEDVEVKKDGLEMEKNNTEPTNDETPRNEDLPKVAVKNKPPRQTRKRARPLEQEVAAENNIRARLRPRRKVFYGA